MWGLADCDYIRTVYTEQEGLALKVSLVRALLDCAAMEARSGTRFRDRDSECLAFLLNMETVVTGRKCSHIVRPRSPHR
jgi:hypothetical protein